MKNVLILGNNPFLFSVTNTFKYRQQSRKGKRNIPQKINKKLTKGEAAKVESMSPKVKQSRNMKFNETYNPSEKHFEQSKKFLSVYVYRTIFEAKCA